MPHPVKSPQQLAKGPFEISNTPDLIPDSTVAFATCKAVPEIVDKVGDSAELIVTYGSLRIENGQVISPDDLLQEPDIQINPKNQTYTLMMVDPDAPAPSNPKYRSWCHWLVCNIPSNDVVRGEEVESYMPPEPGKHRHRYLFLLFRQKNRVTARRLAKRQGFQVKQWAEQHGLDPEPVTGLFFWSAADEE